jgi:hypothetical protein
MHVSVSDGTSSIGLSAEPSADTFSEVYVIYLGPVRTAGPQGRSRALLLGTRQSVWSINTHRALMQIYDPGSTGSTVL